MSMRALPRPPRGTMSSTSGAAARSLMATDAAITFCGHTHLPALFQHDRQRPRSRPSIRMRVLRDPADAAAALGCGDRRRRPAARPQSRPPAMRSTTTARARLPMFGVCRMTWRPPREKILDAGLPAFLRGAARLGGGEGSRASRPGQTIDGFRPRDHSSRVYGEPPVRHAPRPRAPSRLCERGAPNSH